MLIAKRENQAVIGCSGLELEIEGPAKAFPKGESPGASDTRTERRMQNELHASGLVEETFRDNGFLGWHAPSSAVPART